ncbi:MAG: hypothetical protein QOH01_3150 [Verrucomicrobiota bacterium]|jgi:DNA phosphorothioation-dependent restriction protein DptH
MLADGYDRHRIAEAAGVTAAQVSAIAAHVTMGTYGAPTLDAAKLQVEADAAAPRALPANLRKEPQTILQPSDSKRTPVLIGDDISDGQPVFWDPFPPTGSANPHVLIFGESGFGKTYATQCLIAELATKDVPSIVFDYGQGFALDSASAGFTELAHPVEIYASRDGLALNPLQIFSSDVHGPLNVAQRIADTFARVYPKIGIQQHALLREAVLHVMNDAGILERESRTWSIDPPQFFRLQEKLAAYAADPDFPKRGIADRLHSHISTIFVFNTFRSSGVPLEWPIMLNGQNRTFILRLQGLEASLERAVTELLLWNLIGFLESLGPGPLRCFAVLDEAHRLSFSEGSPMDRLLREGRKFGIGVMLASQQPGDFSEVTFSNTATKLVFQTVDAAGKIARLLAAKANVGLRAETIRQTISTLPRGICYLTTANTGRVVSVASMDQRAAALKL